jgi:predicted aspartyl protease
MVVFAEFFLPAQNSVTLKALVDSGASARGFINHFLVQNLKIPTYKTSYTRTLMLANDRAAAEKITNYVILPMRIGNYYENALSFVTKLFQEILVILGLQWLYKHNPSINFRNNSLIFISSYYHRFCLIPE